MSEYTKREDVAKILLQRREFAENQDWTEEVDLMELLCERLDELPSADVVERKNGEWIEEPNCWFRCSNCKQHYPSMRGYMYYNYCPSCGADMRPTQSNDSNALNALGREGTT